MNRIQSLLANKHTSGAAIVYLAAKYGALIGAVWLPSYSSQLKQTAELVEGAAVAWGLLAAGDASQSVKTPPTDQPTKP
jgi:hypothetical protein